MDVQEVRLFGESAEEVPTLKEILQNTPSGMLRELRNGSDRKPPSRHDVLPQLKPVVRRSLKRFFYPNDTKQLSAEDERERFTALRLRVNQFVKQSIPTV